MACSQQLHCPAIRRPCARPFRLQEIPLVAVGTVEMGIPFFENRSLKGDHRFPVGQVIAFSRDSCFADRTFKVLKRSPSGNRAICLWHEPKFPTHPHQLPKSSGRAGIGAVPAIEENRIAQLRRDLKHRPEGRVAVPGSRPVEISCSVEGHASIRQRPWVIPEGV
jgi:hypothetical protein